MPRGKHGKIDEAYLGWVTADSVPVGHLRHYLCSLGPRYCPKCDSQCAFGKRYMEVQREQSAHVDACMAAFNAGQQAMVN
jgi:hypothetical protein